MFNTEIKTLVDSFTDKPDGIVIYTDGSFTPNDQLTGGGIHGYTFKLETPKKGLGLGKYKATKEGYKENPEEQVTVIDYFDGHLSLGRGTNNTAELKAGVASLVLADYATTKDIKDVTILMDSKYVIEGVTKYVDVWDKNSWIKANGQPPANIDIWKTALTTRRSLDSSGTNYKINWVKGHSGDPGNETVDVSAAIGRELNNGINDTAVFVLSDNKGYWKTDISDKVSLIAGTVIIFDATEIVPDEKVHYIFSNDKNDVSLYGIPDTTASYAIAQLNDAPSLINSVISKQNAVISSDLKDSIGGSIFYHLNIRNVFSPDTLNLYGKHGTKVLLPTTKYNELSLIGKDIPITGILYPVRFALEGINYHKSLQLILNGFIANKLVDSEIFKVLEVTKYVYDMKETSSKTSYKLKEELNTSSGKLDLAQYHPEVKTILGDNPLLLSFGSDLPKKEVISGAAKLNPEAHVIYWEDAGRRLRAFVLKTDEGISIWHNPWRSVI